MNAHEGVKPALDALEAALPQLVIDNPDEDMFWQSFSGQADDITENVSADDYAYASGRIDCMLKNAGKIPGEDEGQPCS
jgi:hypothetical protein